MNISFNELINKKKNNQKLTKEEINWLINSYVANTITDYQMSAMLMAIWFNGMSKEEVSNLASAYYSSGKIYDVSDIKEWKADKHSTGGVGDKTSLVFGPLIASYGIKLMKLSGKALGKTGGTIDKLESIPGWKADISETRFKEVVNKVGMSIIGTSKDVAIADKKTYALRDVTGTVDSIPLIAASIMAKKLIIHSDSLILDIKVGSGAFMKNEEEATTLANLMIEIGKAHNRKVSVMLTDMNKPLGRTIGNAIEVKEAYDTLLGNGSEDLNYLTEVAVGIVLVQAGLFNSLQEAQKSVAQKLKNKEAAHYLADFVKEQGGDWSVIENYEDNFKVKNEIKIIAEKSGFVEYTDAEILGYLALDLGAGRKTKEDDIDYSAGIYLNKTSQQKVNKGEVIMTLLTNRNENKNWYDMAKKSFVINESQKKEQVIYKII